MGYEDGGGSTASNLKLVLLASSPAHSVALRPSEAIPAELFMESEQCLTLTVMFSYKC